MSTPPGFLPIGNIAPPVPGLPDQADFNPLLTRTHYFDGRLLTATDLTRDQLYLDQRLREIGQALGSGVVRGLGATLQGGRIEIAPGIAVTASGRVLETKTTVRLDLNDRALIAGLNGGLFLRLPRGLYALVLSYAESGKGVAEVFPQDLAGRTVQYDIFAEGVQAGLVPLPVPLPQTSALAVRAALMRTLAEGGLGDSLVPEEGVALGILGVRDDRPEWLDTTLLRHPVRTVPGPGDLQTDLHLQYERLLADVLAARRPLGGDFAAKDYFRVLPPTGRIPKAAIDPVAGRQSFFPEHFRVWVAPIRQSDLELVQRESLRLPAIDPNRDEPVDLVVLAPLPAQSFGRLAGALERRPESGTRGTGAAVQTPVLLPRLDPLALRLYPLRPVHQLDTDGPAWEALWAQVGDTDPVFVRRPTRAAETGISGIVLALGARIPQEAPVEDGDGPVPVPAPLPPPVLDADAVLLERVNLKRLAGLRPPEEEGAPVVEGRDALETLMAEIGDRADLVLDCLDLCLRIERRFDPVLWQTLLVLAREKRLADFGGRLREGQRELATDEIAAAYLKDLGADAALVERWGKLAARG